MAKRFLVTGGAGFIGAAVVRHLLGQKAAAVLVLDKLTYAGRRETLAAVEADPAFRFVQGDIGDQPLVRGLLSELRPDVILNLAAETHVDRSIDVPAQFVETNVAATFRLLHEALAYWRGLDGAAAADFRFHHISTDEVYGSLGPEGLFTEDSPYRPNSPYSASKASSDHLVRAWHETYGLPTIITNCSNNYGPFQFPEKLIPLTILNAVEGRPLPVYGRGENVRDWLYVDDHAAALACVATRAEPGTVYNVGGHNEVQSIEVVRLICRLIDDLQPLSDGRSRSELITFVPDRPGHDLRYAIDASKIEREFGWSPAETFESGLAKTVRWYLDNRAWWEPIRKVYDGQRLGTAIASDALTEAEG